MISDSFVAILNQWIRQPNERRQWIPDTQRQWVFPCEYVKREECHSRKRFQRTNSRHQGQFEWVSVWFWILSLKSEDRQRWWVQLAVVLSSKVSQKCRKRRTVSMWWANTLDLPVKKMRCWTWGLIKLSVVGDSTKWLLQKSSLKSSLSEGPLIVSLMGVRMVTFEWRIQCLCWGTRIEPSYWCVVWLVWSELGAQNISYLRVWTKNQVRSWQSVGELHSSCIKSAYIVFNRWVERVWWVISSSTVG